MAERYLSLKVTIRALGDKTYLSLIDSELPEVGGGRGNQFTFDPQALCANGPNLPTFLKALSTGAIPAASFLEKFGKCCFDFVFGGENLSSYKMALFSARAAKARLRICMNVLAQDLVDIPWEYLHDGNGFVIKSGPSIVRLLEGVASLQSSFVPVQNLLIAMADPVKSEDFVPFDGEKHLEALSKILSAIGGLTVVPLAHASREGIAEAFRTNEFDAFYFIGHGIYLKDGGGQLVCEDDGKPDFLPADDLASWIRESSTLRFVYLNSCSTAVTSSSNPMQGVAQRLMRDGRVSAVAAMQVDVNQVSAQHMAESFFKLLQQGKSAEDAMLVCRTQAQDLQSFGIPVLYSTFDAPVRFEKNRLSTFLSLKEDSTCALLLPQWTLGLQGKAGADANRKGLEGDEYYYRGPTFATADVNSAWAISTLVGSVLPSNNIAMHSNEEVRITATHHFVFGSKSNAILAGVQELQFTPQFEFDYETKPDYWVIRDKANNRSYEIRQPNDLDYNDFLATTDFGAIQKFTDPSSQRVYFLIAGLGSRATEGCGYFLRDHWSELLSEFGSRDFGIVVKFPKNLSPQEGQRQPPGK